MSDIGYFLLSLFFLAGGFGIGISLALIGRDYRKESSSHDELFNRH